MKNNEVDKALDIIHAVPIIALGTVSRSSQPWITPLFAVYDEGRGVFYWESSITDQHSRNISNNPKASIAVYDSSGSTTTGVYFEVLITEAIDPIIVEKARTMLFMRKGSNNSPKPTHNKDSIVPDTQRIYQATVIKSWINIKLYSDGFVIRDKRKEIELNLHA